MAHSRPLADAVTSATRASLRLVNSSTELLSISQLLAMDSELRTTLAAVHVQIRAKLSDPPTGAVIDLTDWDSSSEGEKEGECEDEDEDECKDKPEDAMAADVPGGNENNVGIPGPYPMTPPSMNEVPSHWYVVDYGLKVGIFANQRCADFAVAGVSGGHQFRANSWVDAATLYNKLYSQGNIIRVQN